MQSFFCIYIYIYIYVCVCVCVYLPIIIHLFLCIISHTKIILSPSLCLSVCLCLHIYKLVTVVEGDMKALFSIPSTSRCWRGYSSFSCIAPPPLDLYLIMLNVKQGGIKYHFLSLWYDSTWD